MSKNIKWGILGTGAAANYVAQSFGKVSDAELIAVGSRSLDSANKFASRFNIKQAYGSYEDFMQDKEIDVVYIATPHTRHLEDCLQCFEANKAVLCEKPFTLNAEDARTIINVARKKELFCMEAMWMRFNPIIKEIKLRIQNNEIGNIQMIKADFGYPTFFDPNSRFYSQEKGGGSMLDRGIYTLSLACFLLGKPEAYYSYATTGKTGVDEQSTYLLKYKSGAIADLSSSLVTYGTNEAIIMGDRGQIRIHDPFYSPCQMSIKYYPEAVSPDKSLIGDSGGLKQRLKDMPLLQKLRQRFGYLIKLLYGVNRVTRTFTGNGYQFEIEEVTKCLKRKEIESKIMPLEETLEIMEIMDGMRKQWRNNQVQESK